MSAPAVTVFHNPDCSKSRRVMEILHERGIAPRVVLYLEVGWTEAGFRALLDEMGCEAHDILRARDAEALGLSLDGAGDGAVLAAMVAHPALVERPIVRGPRGVVVARPPERALDIV